MPISAATSSAKYRRRILEQLGRFAWHIFDQKVVHLQREEYRIRQVAKVTANALEELAERMEGIGHVGFLEEVAAYNAAVDVATPFNPSVKDVRGTKGLAVNRTNSLNRIDETPFEASAVTCGITFSFGGLRINTKAEVLDSHMTPMPGLYAAGSPATKRLPAVTSPYPAPGWTGRSRNV